jgi:hypothetical protein
MAQLTLAPKIAAIALSVWKEEQASKPNILNHKQRECL